MCDIVPMNVLSSAKGAMRVDQPSPAAPPAPALSTNTQSAVSNCVFIHLPGTVTPNRLEREREKGDTFLLEKH